MPRRAKPVTVKPVGIKPLSGPPPRPDANCDIRFIVILVAPGKMPRHIVNAFEASR
jgi:hypothetical protein